MFQNLKLLIEKHERKFSIASVVLTNLLILGRFAPYLGIYYDEIVTFYILERFGFAQLIDLAGGQARQLAGALVALASPNYTVGHILMFLISTACALLLMYLFRRVFPDVPQLGTLFAIIFLVYPVYFVRVYLTALSIDASLLLSLISFSLSYLALKRTGFSRWGLIALSLVLIPIYINLYEMPIALEVMRPFILWAALHDKSENQKISLASTIKWSGIWVLVVGATIFYRLFIFQPYGFYAELEYNTALSTPDDALILLVYVVSGILGNLAVLFNVWVYAFQKFQDLLTAYGVFAGTLIASLAFVLLMFTKKETTGLIDERVRRPLLLANLGFALSLISHILILLVGRQLSPTAFFFSYESRIYIISYIGAAMTLVGLIWFINNSLRSRYATIFVGIISAILIFIGTLAHTSWNNRHAESWDNLRSFMWELEEIAPNLHDGTTIIVDHNHMIVELDYLSFIVGDLFYNNRSISLVLTSETSPEEIPSFEADNGDWGFGWTANFEQAILVYEDEAACLHLIDPAQPIPENFHLSEEALALLPLLPANPSQFIIDTPVEDSSLRERYFPRPTVLSCEARP